MRLKATWADVPLLLGQSVPSPCRAPCLKHKVTKTSTHECRYTLTPPSHCSLPCSTSLGSLHFPWQKDKGQAASTTQGCQSQASSRCPPPCSPARGFLHCLRGHNGEEWARGLQSEGWRLERGLWQRITKRQELLRRIEKKKWREHCREEKGDCVPSTEEITGNGSDGGLLMTNRE